MTMSNLTNYPVSEPLQNIEEGLNPVKDVDSKAATDSGEQFDFFQKSARQQFDRPSRWISRRNLSIVLLVIGSHVVAFAAYLYAQHDPVVIPKKKEVLIEFVRPVVPEKKTEPPPPLPSKVEHKPQPAKSTPALKTQLAQQDIRPDDITVQENTTAQTTPGPVAAAPTTSTEPVAAGPVVQPPPVPKEEPVTEATGYAGYLNNPAPEYPLFAQRQGWGGRVILRVRVLANGKAGSVEVKQSSGRKILDEAAQEVVKTWMFAPAKRGNTPIDGWATVPIEFRV
ncbi:energy transducer TonB [Methylophilus sp. 'Pure River']|uniref:energy transducer TonB n=1 Tax=Methylophilus sp. 'Pure River' TaxID=3377117 RepID=UPI00398E79A3